MYCKGLLHREKLPRHNVKPRRLLLLPRRFSIMCSWRGAAWLVRTWGALPQSWVHLLEVDGDVRYEESGEGQQEEQHECEQLQGGRAGLVLGPQRALQAAHCAPAAPAGFGSICSQVTPPRGNRSRRAAGQRTSTA